MKLRLTLIKAGQELILARAGGVALPEAVTVEADPVVPLNRDNLILFRDQEHKTKWMGALTDLLLASVERMDIEDNKGDEDPGGGGGG